MPSGDARLAARAAVRMTRSPRAHKNGRRAREWRNRREEKNESLFAARADPVTSPQMSGPSYSDFLAAALERALSELRREEVVPPEREHPTILERVRELNAAAIEYLKAKAAGGGPNAPPAAVAAPLTEFERAVRAIAAARLAAARLAAARP